jgi:hypothetical protein
MAGRADNDPALRVHRIGFLASRKRMVALATVSLSSISIEYSAGVWRRRDALAGPLLLAATAAPKWLPATHHLCREY